MCIWIPTGLPALSSTKLDLGQAHQHRLAVPHLELRLDAAADHLLRGNAVDPLRPGAHELDAAARDDERLEAVRPQVGEQLEHRLVDHLGVEPPGPGMLRRRDPVGDDPVELLGGRAGVRGHGHLEERVLAARERRLHVALQHRREGLLVRPLRVLRGERPDPIEDEERLEVHRLLGPQRAVVVEYGDALGRRHVAGHALPRDRLQERDDRPSGRTVVPARQRVRGLEPDGSASGQGREQSHGQSSRHHGPPPGLPVKPWPNEPGRTPSVGCGPARRLGPYCFDPAVTASMTRSRLKLPGFCRGGNSLKLCSHWPT